MCCARYYERTLHRVPTSGKGRRRGREREEGRSKRLRQEDEGWMNGWGYTKDGRQGQERVQAAATPIVELDDGPGQVQVQDGGGDNNREKFCSSCHHQIRMPRYILLYLFRRTKRTGQTKRFLFYFLILGTNRIIKTPSRVV